MKQQEKRRPFKIRVKPRQWLERCDKMKGEIERGLIGFHNYTSCPNCKLVNDGWELWGENGHMQGHVRQDQNLQENLENRKRVDRSLHTYLVFEMMLDNPMVYQRS